MAELILETERLGLRRLTEGDFADVRTILQDERVTYAYSVTRVEAGLA